LPAALQIPVKAQLEATPATDRSARCARRAAARWIWLGNVALGTCIGLAYVRDLAPDAPAHVWWFAYLGLVSTVATLSSPVGLALVLAARTRIGERAFVALQSVAWMLFQIALVIDTRVWGLFRYHFNAAAWNLITSKGSEDSYELGPRIWAVGIGLGAAFAAAQALAHRWLVSRERRPLPRSRLLRPAAIAAALVLLAVCVEKSIYAHSGLFHDPQVAAISRAFPMYPRLDLKPLLPDPLRAQLSHVPRVEIAHSGARLDYPRALPGVDPDGPRPNILIVVVDSWRADMLRSDVTPNLHRFASEARRFDDHLSGGNGTRFGVFALLYGLHGSYWWPVLAEKRTPVLIDVLGELGYELRVFSAASMDFPEFRATAWSRMADRVHDDFGEHRQALRDQLAAESCARFLRTRDRGTPFFAFVLLDSAHQKYDFPEGEAPFAPYAKQVDYLELAGSRDPELVRLVGNRYKNALHYVDRVAAGLLAELDLLGLAGETVVVVTGDHGEEFAEHGHWGHTGNFSREQVAVPFAMRGPGIAPGVEKRPTSHVDVPATLLELLGADPADRPRWCLSENMLSPPETRARAVSGWDDLGLWTPTGVLRIPREPDHSYAMCAYDADWKLASDPLAPFEREARALRALEEECARFLRTPARFAALPPDGR
jgi:hypothetical protein